MKVGIISSFSVASVLVSRKLVLNVALFFLSLIDWQTMLAEACNKWSSKSMLAALCRLILSSTVYRIWQARNAIKFQGQILMEEQILRRIY